MELTQYERLAGSTVLYNGRGTMSGLIYAAMALGGEVGEFQNIVKKGLRGDYVSIEVWMAAHKSGLADELGDVLWYVTALAYELGYSLDEIAEMNLEKLAMRSQLGTIKGGERGAGQ